MKVPTGDRDADRPWVSANVIDARADSPDELFPDARLEVVGTPAGGVRILMGASDISHDHRILHRQLPVAVADRWFSRVARDLAYILPPHLAVLEPTARWYAACFPALALGLQHGELDAGPVPQELVGALRRPTWAAAAATLSGRRMSRQEVRCTAQMIACGSGARRWLPATLLPITAVLEDANDHLEVLENAVLQWEGPSQTPWTLADSSRIRTLLDLLEPGMAAQLALRVATTAEDAHLLAQELEHLDLSGIRSAVRRLDTVADVAVAGINPVIAALQRSWLDRHGSHRTPAALRRLNGAGDEGGWRLLSARDGWQVKQWGDVLENCLGSHYPRRVVHGEIMLLGATRQPGAVSTLQPELAIEIDAQTGGLASLLGTANRHPTAVDAVAVWELLIERRLVTQPCEGSLPPPGVLQVALDAVTTPHVGSERGWAPWISVALWVAGYVEDAGSEQPHLATQLRTRGPIPPSHPPPDYEEVLAYQARADTRDPAVIGVLDHVLKQLRPPRGTAEQLRLPVGVPASTGGEFEEHNLGVR